MQKFAVRLLALSLLGTALAIAPVVSDANAATTHNGKQIKKRATHHAVARSQASNPNANPFASKPEDDFERKSANGGGGY